eukprot:scaffold1579_cov102-Skeletonema_dohrnii-CCMP3373.AAC.8
MVPTSLNSPLIVIVWFRSEIIIGFSFSAIFQVSQWSSCSEPSTFLVFSAVSTLFIHVRRPWLPVFCASSAPEPRCSVMTQDYDYLSSSSAFKLILLWSSYTSSSPPHFGIFVHLDHSLSSQAFMLAPEASSAHHRLKRRLHLMSIFAMAPANVTVALWHIFPL